MGNILGWLIKEEKRGKITAETNFKEVIPWEINIYFVISLHAIDYFDFRHAIKMTYGAINLIYFERMYIQ